MARIFKYPLNTHGLTDMPDGSRLLHVNAQRDQFYVWAEVHHPDAEMRGYDIMIVGTGAEPPQGYDYRNTFMAADGAFVGHVYTRGDMGDPVAPPVLIPRT